MSKRRREDDYNGYYGASSSRVKEEAYEDNDRGYYGGADDHGGSSRDRQRGRGSGYHDSDRYSSRRENDYGNYENTSRDNGYDRYQSASSRGSGARSRPDNNYRHSNGRDYDRHDRRSNIKEEYGGGARTRHVDSVSTPIKTVKMEIKREEGHEWKDKKATNTSFVTRWLEAEEQKEVKRKIIESLKSEITNWQNMWPHEWITEFARLISGSRFVVEEPVVSGSLWGYSDSNLHSCIYQFSDWDNANKDLILVAKQAEDQEEARNMCAIATIQRWHDLDIIPNSLLQKFFLPDQHFFPKKMFDNEDIHDKIVNVDFEEAERRYELFQTGGPQYKDSGFDVNTSKGRIHRFGELWKVPTKIHSQATSGKTTTRPRKGVKMESQTTSTLEFWFEMQLYSQQIEGYVKKELEQEVALKTVNALYWSGKLDRSGEEISKKNMQKRINERGKEEAETLMQRFQRLADLDYYGCYNERNAPTRLELLNKQIFKKGAQMQQINTIEHISNDLVREFMSDWTVVFPYPSGSSFPNRFIPKGSWDLDPSLLMMICDTPEKAMQREVTINVKSVDAKKKQSQNKCKFEFMQTLYRLGIVEPYTTLPTEMLPKLDPHLIGQKFMVERDVKLGKYAGNRTKPEAYYQRWSNRLEWSNYGEFCYNYSLYSMGAETGVDSFDPEHPRRRVVNAAIYCCNEDLPSEDPKAWATNEELQTKYPDLCYSNEARQKREEIKSFCAACPPKLPEQPVADMQMYVKTLNSELKSRDHRLDLDIPFVTTMQPAKILQWTKNEITAFFRQKCDGEDTAVFNLKDFLLDRPPKTDRIAEVDTTVQGRWTVSFEGREWKLVINWVPEDWQLCKTYQQQCSFVRSMTSQQFIKMKANFHKAYWMMKRLKTKGVPWNDAAIALVLRNVRLQQKEAVGKTGRKLLGAYDIMFRAFEVWYSGEWVQFNRNIYLAPEVHQSQMLCNTLAFKGLTNSQEEQDRRQFRLNAFISKAGFMLDKLSCLDTLRDTFVKSDIGNVDC